ncbi:3'-5' exoribonuclease [Klebsiella pneumoniae]|nr:3'-5' exoribonuclease [Klebsiella pneumoniae]MBK2966028.1 3'-5' exoribonuclease [Klebsiella pneumoniae]MDZ3697544.1 3'-5' exoribonuclease [Klebsiella pneumoniae]MDZ3785994.1 3'-5' exoribonuclease [Klebsiella pneumoniae]MDZ3801251.1 3'-5' exoribonuclease [Klebsiella pneumoniae]
MNHLMVDLIIINEKESSPLLAIEAVFFEPSTGQIGKSFYSPINIRMATGLVNVDTAFEWMKKDSHWRAELMSATESEEGVMCDLAGFIADNTEHRFDSLFVWFKDTPEKLVSLQYAVERAEVPGIFPKGAKFRCIRSLLDLAAATGYAPHGRRALVRYTMTDARYQAEQVCEIWQRLTSPHIESL